MARHMGLASVGAILLLGVGCGAEKAMIDLEPNDGAISMRDGALELDARADDGGMTLDAAAPPPPPGDTGTPPPPPTTDSGMTDMAVGVDLGVPDMGPPSMLAPGPTIGTFDITFYWVAYEGDHPDGSDTNLYDDGCSVIATVPADFADAISLEGTGRLLDGRMLNVSGGCGCPTSPCFFELDAEHPWGVGVSNRPLVPFRSIAIDRGVLDIGTSYYVEELDGLPMPGDPPWGAFVHDGCLTADDVGGGITGMHIDFFAALREHYRTLVGDVGDPVQLHEGGERCP